MHVSSLLRSVTLHFVLLSNHGERNQGKGKEGISLLIKQQSLRSWNKRMASRSVGSSSSSKTSFMANSDIPHVLAVDDSLVERKLVEKLLRNSSCRVTTAENGPKALEFLGLGSKAESIGNCRGSKVNLILTDYCMPGMTGYELLKKIKQSSEMREVPVVIMSSESIPTLVNKCLAEGALMFIQKPLEQSDVNRLTYHLLN